MDYVRIYKINRPNLFDNISFNWWLVVWYIIPYVPIKSFSSESFEMTYFFTITHYSCRWFHFPFLLDFFLLFVLFCFVFLGDDSFVFSFLSVFFSCTGPICFIRRRIFCCLLRMYAVGLAGLYLRGAGSEAAMRAACSWVRFLALFW